MTIYELNKKIAELREETGASFLLCREALFESSGDKKQAIMYIEKKCIAVRRKMLE